MPAGHPQVNRSALKTLLRSVGGEHRLKEILRDFYQRMAKDLMIGFFFEGKNIEEIADMQLKFLLRAMGVRKSYPGKNPTNAHMKIPPILSGHFDRRLRILEKTLNDQGLTEKSIEIWIAFENAFREVIVQE